MKVFENVPKRLLTLFNAKYGTALTLDQVEFKNPRPTANITPKPGTTKNTAVTLAMRPGAAYTGETTVYYDRMSLGKAWLNAPLLGELAIPVENETTVHQLLPKLYQRLGAKFLPTDLIDSPLGLTNYIGSVVLRAAETSLSWYGSVEIGIWSANRPAEFNVQYPGKFWIPDDVDTETSNHPLTSRRPPSLDTYYCDYSSQYNALKAIAATSVYKILSADGCWNLAAALKAVDGLNWNYNTAYATSYNLSGAVVFYNGPIKDYPAWLAANQKLPYIDNNTDLGLLVNPFNPEYDNAMLIRPDRPWSDTTGYRLFFIVHYNNPL